MAFGTGESPLCPVVWGPLDLGACNRPRSRAAHLRTGSGPPAVVFVHGWGGGPLAYTSVVRSLADEVGTVAAPTLPGFAGTPALQATDATLPGYARWMACYLTALEVEEPILLVGHCVGAAVALQFAAQHPGRVRAVLACNPVAPASWRGRRRWRAKRVGSDAPIVDDARSLVHSGVPVDVVWSEDDRVTRYESFVRCCRAAGIAGEVVPGGHRWLITDPDGFKAIALAAMARGAVGTPSVS